MVRRYRLPIASICSAWLVMLLGPLSVCTDTNVQTFTLAEHFGVSRPMQVVTFFSPNV
jgi:hypothetical protein